MVPLTTTASAFEARVIAAHLGAEGIVWELRGNVEGPYPVGPVVVLVTEDDLAVAREVVGRPADLEPADPGAGDLRAGHRGAAGGSPRALWFLLAAVLVAAATLLGRLLVLTWQ
jgi:hypothetical protein